ncbi:ShlB/FhaC/HecB family hemolysin secretion/activation protein [Roseateles sp. LYH14W]|uniref:ShlB/FhaC/HecB family hemolysin secretion/activation protein n=1 Tax=Pelomonas parva TaxID=3299032 RepID=A0ABW7F0G3_9BURK
MTQTLLAAALASLLALPGTAQAAAPAGTPPGSGDLLQQLKPAQPPMPAPANTGLRVQQGSAESLPASQPFAVRQVRIIGNTLVDTATLHALVAAAEGRSLTLQQLEDLARHITAHYQARGYLVSQAIVPAQTIKDGIVTLQVVEARLGKVVLDNQSRAATSLLQATLATLQAGGAVEQERIEHALLLISDISGLTVNAVLKPGEQVATSDLVATVQPRPAVSGSVQADNLGNPVTGRARLGANVTINTPLGLGDALSLFALTSGSDMRIGMLDYESVVTGSGTRLGASYSTLRYKLGGDFKALGGHGTADTWSLRARQPLARSRTFNLHGQVQAERLNLRDQVDSAGIQSARRVETLSASLSGDSRDVNGLNFWRLALTGGQVRFNNAVAQQADAVTTRTRGGFHKLNLSLARLQGLDANTSVLLNVAGQWTQDNLDPSQKMSVGGAYNVRAYDMGSLSADSGYTATAELRRRLGAAWQVQAFVDAAQVTVNRKPWDASQPNRARLYGAGLGLEWSNPEGWAVKANIAQRLGKLTPLLDTAARSRAWIQLSKEI